MQLLLLAGVLTLLFRLLAPVEMLTPAPAKLDSGPISGAASCPVRPSFGASTVGNSVPPLLTSWGLQRPPASVDACVHTAAVRVIMADSRALDVSMLNRSVPTLAAALNAAYAMAHGYDFVYYRVQPTLATAESASGDMLFGGAKGDYCTVNAALGAARKTPWCKLLVLWSLLQEELSAAPCPPEKLFFIDSDAFVTPSAGAALALDAMLNRTARLMPVHDRHDETEPPGGYARWVEPPGWRPPAAHFLFASCRPWWPQGPTTGTFVIDGVDAPRGRATAAAVLAKWWDARQPPLPSAYKTIAKVSSSYSWNEMHPYEQAPVMLAVDVAKEVQLFSRNSSVIGGMPLLNFSNPFLAIARHMGVLDMETFRDQDGQFVRHASSYDLVSDGDARLKILNAAAKQLGLTDAALANHIHAIRVVVFDGYAAETRLRAGFLNRTAALDVHALIAEGDIRPAASADS